MLAGFDVVRRCWPKPENGCDNMCRLSLPGGVLTRNSNPRREDGNLMTYHTRNSIMLQALSMGDESIPKHKDCINDCASVDMTIVHRPGLPMNLDTCVWGYCRTKPVAAVASNTPAVEMRRKRWGNRLCMEIHCRSLEHDIASYVNCGIKHCA